MEPRSRSGIWVLAPNHTGFKPINECQNSSPNLCNSRCSRLFRCFQRLPRQLPECFPQLRRAVDHNATANTQQHCGNHLQPVAPAAHACSPVFFLDGHAQRNKAFPRLLYGQVDPHINLILRLNKRHAGAQVLPRVEIGRPAKASSAGLEVGHAIQPKGAQRASREAISDQIPTPISVHHRVRFDVAARCVSIMGQVVEADALSRCEWPTLRESGAPPVCSQPMGRARWPPRRPRFGCFRAVLQAARAPAS